MFFFLAGEGRANHNSLAVSKIKKAWRNAKKGTFEHSCQGKGCTAKKFKDDTDPTLQNVLKQHEKSTNKNTV